LLLRGGQDDLPGLPIDMDRLYAYLDRQNHVREKPGWMKRLEISLNSHQRLEIL